MQKLIYVPIVLFLFLFVLFFPKNETVLEKIETVSDGLYYFKGTNIYNTWYNTETDGYITLPELPYGFKLFYESETFAICGYPRLTCESLRTTYNDSLYKLSFLPISQLYVAKDGLYIKCADSNDITFLSYEEQNVVKVENKSDFLYETLYEFYYIDEEAGYEEHFYDGGNYSMKAVNIQDAVKNKKYNTDVTTPVVDSIVKLIMVNEDDPIFAGKATWGYFTFHPKTGQIEYLKDEAEYNTFVLENFYTGYVWESPYVYENKETSEGVNYSVTTYVKNAAD